LVIKDLYIQIIGYNVRDTMHAPWELDVVIKYWSWLWFIGGYIWQVFQDGIRWHAGSPQATLFAAADRCRSVLIRWSEFPVGFPA